MALTHRARRMALSTSTLLVGTTLVLAGCGSGSSTSSGSTAAAGTAATTTSPAPVTISSATLKGLGPVLVNSEGHTLYMFVPDKRATVTCMGTCAQVWPPVSIPTGQTAVASGAVNAALLGSVPNPNPGGGSVVTYNKWPLYTYVPDTAKGDHDGQALNVNGGLWYVMSPAGKVITVKAAG